jgi:hypothetical protein
MTSAGGWCPDGVYVIPVGAAGTSNYVGCSSITGAIGPTPSVADLSITGTLSDILIRWPVDYVDASRFNCSVYSGTPLECVSTDIYLQPVTFQVMLTYSANVTQVPTLDTKTACPLTASNRAGTNICRDVWTNTTTDIAPVTLPACNSGASTPVECFYAYTWTPTGITGGYEVEIHTGPVPNGTFIYVNNFELKQTPGATCAGTAPPCINYYPGPIELPDVEADIQRNARFAQMIGTGYTTGWNPGNLGPVETVTGFAYSTTQFVASWPLPTRMRCDYWDAGGPKGFPTCGISSGNPYNVYFNGVTDYTFITAGPASHSATALAVGQMGMSSLQVFATTSGLTAGQPGYVQWGTGNSDMILIENAQPGG